MKYSIVVTPAWIYLIKSLLLFLSATHLSSDALAQTQTLQLANADKQSSVCLKANGGGAQSNLMRVGVCVYVCVCIWLHTSNAN